MKINVKFDNSALRARLPREEKRLAFNTAQALNETAKAIQLAERANLDRKFKVRMATFMYRLIKVFKFASARQGRPFAEIGIDPTKQRVLLGIFEKGGDRPPAKGKSVAVPLTGGPARPSFSQSVLQAFRFTALRLHPRPRRKPLPFHPSALGAARQAAFIGAQHTFQIPGTGVFQRLGGAIRAVYLYVRRPHLEPRLDFYKVAKDTAEKEWPEQFRKAYRK